MPKKIHDKLKIMEEIIELGKKGEELTIYNITKKLNQSLRESYKHLKWDDIEKHYIKEQTISNAINELKKLNCIEIKSIERTKTGKEKKIYVLKENSEKIFEIYKRNYLKIHKIIKILKSDNVSDEELEIIINILKGLLR